MTVVTDNRRARMSAGLQARTRAVNELIAANQAEYDLLYREARLAYGLPAIPGGKSPEKIAAQIERTQGRLEKLMRELAAANGEPV